MRRHLVWFSCGAASAVAAKLSVEKYGDACEVVYCDTMATEHPDNARFFADVERWIGRPITVVRSPKFTTIDDVFERTRYMSGIAGARCTVELKKLPREAFQQTDDIHIFGYTSDEQKRADSFEDTNPSLFVEWVLIDQGVSKADCLRILKEAGIALPTMYALGFDHNNCIGCPKATSPGYWNRVRRHFPEIFARRARQSRLIGAKLPRVKGTRIFLDLLPPDADAPDDAIECGPVCQTPEIE
jgi:3'-phosphoadenosine 5'-phosphosulfate sulfotransferase (PAPS reductase)/FAD synthetase